MKIAVLTNAYPPKAQGGAGRIGFEYTKILEGLGHEVKVWGPGEEFFALGKSSAWARLFFHLKDLKGRKDIVEWIVAWKPEVLFTHNLTGCGFGTAKSIKYAVRGTEYDKAFWFHVLHDVQLFEPSGQIVYGESFVSLRKVWRWIWARLRRANLGEPDIVISPTKWLMDEHLKRGFFAKTRKEIVPNPIAMPPVTGTERDEKQILFVGRLDFDKGIDLLLKAWPKLKKFCDKFVVVGSGERLEELKRRFPEVEFRGQLAQEDVVQVMAQSGALVLPSLVLENQPTVIIEALKCGCKVVASDVGGVMETLGEAGWIFEPGSAEGLARSIEQASASRTAYRVPRTDEEILKNHEPGTVAGILAGLLKSNL